MKLSFNSIYAYLELQNILLAIELWLIHFYMIFYTYYVFRFDLSRMNLDQVTFFVTFVASTKWNKIDNTFWNILRYSSQISNAKHQCGNLWIVQTRSQSNILQNYIWKYSHLAAARSCQLMQISKEEAYFLTFKWFQYISVI